MYLDRIGNNRFYRMDRIQTRREVEKEMKLNDFVVIASVKNAPAVIKSGFVVARQFDGDLWYYGTYETEERAYDVAQELGNGVVLYRE